MWISRYRSDFLQHNFFFLILLQYADDIVLISDNLIEVHEIVCDLDGEASKIGLKMNIQMTKVMCKDPKIIAESTELENVLGRENPTSEINRRKKLALEAFGKLYETLKHKKIPLYLRTQLFDQCLLALLTYGSQIIDSDKIIYEPI